MRGKVAKRVLWASNAWNVNFNNGNVNNNNRNNTNHVRLVR